MFQDVNLEDLEAPLCYHSDLPIRTEERSKSMMQNQKWIVFHPQNPSA